MTRTTRAMIAVGVLTVTLVLFAIGDRYLGGYFSGYLTLDQDAVSAPTSTAIPALTAIVNAHPSFLYGRITIEGGTTYEGRLRWGRDQEAFWGDFFNGFKDTNPWAAHVPSERLSKESESIEIFGIPIWKQEEQVDLGRPFMTRFGDIARIELIGRDVRVTLKSGTAFDLDYYSFNDFDDGVRVWDAKHGVLDLGPGRIRTIDLLSDSSAVAVPRRLHGTVRTRQGDFTGFIQWNRKEGLGSDELDGRTADGNLSLRFDAMRSISRSATQSTADSIASPITGQGDSSLVTLLDGREIVLSDTPEVGKGNLGIYVDDRRYGRVLISWAAFNRLDFSPSGSGPAYNDFPPGHPLTGSITTRSGSLLSGRMVYDLDESETTETLDAPSQGVDYLIPFGLIASIMLPGPEERGAQANVTLHSGEELQLDRTGDLGEGNAGILIFIDGNPRPEYVPWTDVSLIDFNRPPSMYPPTVGR